MGLFEDYERQRPKDAVIEEDRQEVVDRERFESGTFQFAEPGMQDCSGGFDRPISVNHIGRKAAIRRMGDSNDLNRVYGELRELYGMDVSEDFSGDGTERIS
ncbi:MAG: hypothetical protein WC553_02105 [Patescibacteria group bacterium]|jgi:hypothetical protein